MRGAGQGVVSLDVVPGDAREPEDVEKVVRAAVDRYGRLDGVVSCVGTVHR